MRRRASSDGPAIDSVIDEPLVQSGERSIDRPARRKLDDKERDKKNCEQPRGD
jgi:hypothetical protein